MNNTTMRPTKTCSNTSITGRMARLPIALLCLFLGAFSEADVPVSWDIHELAKNKVEKVSIGFRKATYKRVATSRLRTVSEVMLRVQERAELEPFLLLVRGREPHAYAAYSNGSPAVIVNFAMLDLIGDQADQWAALLGHELAHLKLNHLDAKRRREFPLQLVDLAVQMSTGNLVSRAATVFATDAVAAAYSREQERESDYLGTVWAMEAGFDPMGAAHLLRRMKAHTKSVIPFLSTHPTSPARIRDVSSLARRLAPDPNDLVAKIQAMHQETTFRGGLRSANRIEAGMSASEVRSIMGRPVFVDTGKEFTEWHFCEAGRPTDQFAMVLINESSFVIAVRAYESEPVGVGLPCARGAQQGTYRDYSELRERP